MSLHTFLNNRLCKIGREVGLSHEILVGSCSIEVDVTAVDALIVAVLAEKAFVSELFWEMDKF